MLIHDRDPLFTAEFLNMIADAGVESVKLPPRSPNLNAYAERFVRGIKESCLERMIFFGEEPLRTAIQNFVAHYQYHSERNHQGLANQLISPELGHLGNAGEAEALLAKLRKRLDEPVSWEQKRGLIEVLVAGVRVDTVEECGVKQTRTTVTYRFSEPDHPMPLVLPQSCSAAKVIRIPTVPQTIGDHIRRRRLALKLLQKEVAERIGVDKCSVFNWEANGSTPRIRYMPAIIGFLGYNPLPPPEGMGERLVRRRTSLGLSQKEFARQIGVDPGTLALWERGEPEPTGSCLASVERFLQDGEPSNARLAG